MLLRALAILIVLSATPQSALADAGSAQPSPMETALHLLDYVSVEYPQFVRGGQVVNATEYAEQVEFAGEIEQTIRSLPAAPERSAIAAQAVELGALIRAKADGATVSGLARELQRNLIAAYHVPVTPRKVPELSTAAAVYAANCAACHGQQGDGTGPQAAHLNPPPTSFRDPARQSERSVYALYSTITQGIAGTAMRSFSTLTEEDRWKLAFYVSQFVSPDEMRARGAAAWARGEWRPLFKDMSALVTMTPAEARRHRGDAEAVLAYLRAAPAELAPTPRSPIAFSLEALARSLDAYRSGQAEDAYQLAVTAYVEGFELTEAGLDTRDHALRTRTEAAMMAFRNAIRQGRPPAEVERHYTVAAQLLRDADARLSEPTASPTANFISSLVIILREGLEAILVLAAMAAFLVRTGRRDGLPWLHGGWVVALLLGGLTWVVSTRVIAISGAHREVTEGVTALISAGLLLYVGFWLHSKANAVRWSQFIRSQMTSALGGGTLFWVALVSFLAVYREVFETVLFYQALWIQSEGGAQTAVVSGLGVGAVILVVTAWLIARYSVRLPLGLFFRISSALLALMAVVFAGQGIAALQEAGKLAAEPLDFPSIPVLGIYPSMQGIALQLILVTLIIAGYLYLRSDRRS